MDGYFSKSVTKFSICIYQTVYHTINVLYGHDESYIHAALWMCIIYYTKNWMILVNKIDLEYTLHT